MSTESIVSEKRVLFTEVFLRQALILVLVFAIFLFLKNNVDSVNTAIWITLVISAAGALFCALGIVSAVAFKDILKPDSNTYNKMQIELFESISVPGACVFTVVTFISTAALLTVIAIPYAAKDLTAFFVFTIPLLMFMLGMFKFSKDIGQRLDIHPELVALSLAAEYSVIIIVIFILKYT